jgi:hypothetical protein
MLTTPIYSSYGSINWNPAPSTPPPHTDTTSRLRKAIHGGMRGMRGMLRGVRGMRGMLRGVRGVRGVRGMRGTTDGRINWNDVPQETTPLLLLLLRKVTGDRLTRDDGTPPPLHRSATQGGGRGSLEYITTPSRSSRYPPSRGMYQPFPIRFPGLWRKIQK